MGSGDEIVIIGSTVKPRLSRLVGTSENSADNWGPDNQKYKY